MAGALPTEVFDSTLELYTTVQYIQLILLTNNTRLYQKIAAVQAHEILINIRVSLCVQFLYYVFLLCFSLCVLILLTSYNFGE